MALQPHITPTAPTMLSDKRRTLVMHVMEDPPGRYSWRIVVEEHCGGADCDSTIESSMHYASMAEAEAACWACGNGMLDLPRTTGGHTSSSSRHH